MSTTPTQVAAAYQAILRTSAPGGATGAYAKSVSASIDQGALTFGNFELSLIGLIRPSIRRCRPWSPSTPSIMPHPAPPR